MDTLGRRDLFRIIGTAGVAAGASSCSGVIDDVIPPAPVRQRAGPQKQVTTMCGACTAGCGLSVRLVGEDAVQLNGTPGHPVNDGGLCPRGVAEIQNLYHPDRLKAPGERDGERGAGRFNSISWDAALARVVQGLTGPVVIGVGSATALEWQLLRRIAAKTGARLVRVELGAGVRPRAGYQAFFGTEAIQPDFEGADLVLSVGSDWLQAAESPVEAQRTFAQLRSGDRPVRMITADARLSVTASRSHMWVPVPQSKLGLFALALCRAVAAGDDKRIERLPGLAAVLGNASLSLEVVARDLDIPLRLLQRTADALRAAHHPVIVVDDAVDAPTQVAAIALQLLAGDAGVGLIRRGELVLPAAPGSDLKVEPALPVPSEGAAVLLFGANPVFLQPRSGWEETLHRARFVVAVGPFLDETGWHADVLLPGSTSLESRQLTWGTAADGQPFVSGGPAAVKPLYQALENVEILARLARGLDPTTPWKSADEVFAAAVGPLGAGKLPGEGGFVRPASAAPMPLAVLAAASSSAADTLNGLLKAATPADGSLELQTYVPLAFAGGLGAQLPFLHGLTGTGGREVWRTVIEMHPHAAARAGVTEDSPVVVETTHGAIRGIARLREGIRPDTVAVATGLGRTAGGRWAAGHGDNPLTLTPPGAPVRATLRSA